MTNISLNLLAIAALGAFPAHAVAGPKADCLWASLPDAKRDRVIVAYSERGRDGVRSADILPNNTAAMLCLGAPASRTEATAIGRAVGQLMALTAVERASLAKLQDQGYDLGSIERVWTALGAKKRIALRGYAATLNGAKVDMDPLVDVVLEAAQQAGWDPAKGDQPATWFGDYFISRAMREALEENL